MAIVDKTHSLTIEEAFNKVDSGGGPDSPNYDFICNIKREVNYDETIDDDVVTWTSDKTYEELYAALYEDSTPFLIKFEGWEDGELYRSEEFPSYKATSSSIKDGIVFNTDYITTSSNIRFTDEIPEIIKVTGRLTRLYVYSDGTFDFDPDEASVGSYRYIVQATKNENVWTLGLKSQILLSELIRNYVEVWVSFNTTSVFEDHVTGKIISASAVAAAGAADKRYKFVIHHPINGPVTFEATQNDDYPTWTEGSGGEALIVTMTDTDQSTYRLDKTYAEILAAVEAGRNVQVQYENEANQINLYVLQQLYISPQGGYWVIVWNYNDDDYQFVAQSADGVLETIGV